MLDLTRLDEAIRSEGGITRRLWLAYCAALAAIPTLGERADGQAKKKGTIKGDPFKHLGVASGEPTAHGVVLWTRLAPHHLQENGGMPPGDFPVRWEIWPAEGKKKVLDSGTVEAREKLGHSVHVVVKKLEPGTRYRYQFHCGDASSPIGYTRTMPKVDTLPEKLRFAFASCQNYEDGYYTAYRHMARDDPDFVVFLGDYIYEFTRKDKHVRKHHGASCKTLAEYRARYCQYRADELLRDMHARCPWIVTWDDHEVEGNYANAISKVKGIKPKDFLERRAGAYQAYYEMMPLRAFSVPKGPHMQLYRTVSFGQLAAFQVLDTRQYRTDQVNNDEHAVLNAAARSPNNTQLGAEQKKWLFEALQDSTAAWNVLAQQVMMGMVDRHGDQKYTMDAWPGYFAERKELIEFLERKKIKNPVVISGDVHSNWVNELRADDREKKLPVVATEFVGTSISSNGDGTPVGAKRLAQLMDVNPCVKFHNHDRGYVFCTVTPKEWKSAYRVVSKVSEAGGAVSIAATFVVTAGQKGAARG